MGKFDGNEWKKKEPGGRDSIRGQANSVASSMERASMEMGGGQIVKVEFHRVVRGGIIITPDRFHKVTIRFVVPLSRGQIMKMMQRGFPNYRLIQERV